MALNVYCVCTVSAVISHQSVRFLHGSIIMLIIIMLNDANHANADDATYQIIQMVNCTFAHIAHGPTAMLAGTSSLPCLLHA